MTKSRTTHRDPSAPVAPTVLELFAGIGGLSLGLERAGFRVVGQVELDPFCRSVLEQHWPEVPRHDDVRTTPTWWASKPRPDVDLVTGGFPCQPFSGAGRRLGMGDPRWGWPWMFDVVRVVRPRVVLVENVATLLDDTDAFGTILADLAALGMDAEWGVLSACALGAPHTRNRLFVVAHTHREHGETRLAPGQRRTLQTRHRAAGAWADPVDGLMEAARRSPRMAHGIPDRLEPHRVRTLGNAVVPAVAEHLGHHIRPFLTGTDRGHSRVPIH